MSKLSMVGKMGKRLAKVKRGTGGPAPARDGSLWDEKAKRAGGLVVSLPNGDALCAVRPEVAFAGGLVPSAEDHALYDAIRLARFHKWQEDVEVPAMIAKGFNFKRIKKECLRTYTMRYIGGRWEKEVERMGLGVAK